MIDLSDILREKIKEMKPGDTIFRLLKEELMALGYWRNRPRGDPKKGYRASWGKNKN